MTDFQPKKPFVDPHLVVYGDIQQITSSIGKEGAPDSNPRGQMIKTR